jgi:hypothetical protein
MMATQVSILISINREGTRKIAILEFPQYGKIARHQERDRERESEERCGTH